MRVLLLDIETAPHTAYVWGLFDKFIPLDRVIESGYTLCWAAKWLGDREIFFDSVEESGEVGMLIKIHALLEEADVVVHYNGTRFDIPTLNKEFLQNGILPPSPYKQVDLLKTARQQFRFASNKLDYVAQFLGFEGKKKHKGFKLWVDCMEGDPKSWRMMKSYNKQDVRLLEQVYKKLLPWIKNHPNAGVYKFSERPLCPTCGSSRVQYRGVAVTKTCEYDRRHCQACGTWSRSVSNNRDPVMRKRLLVKE